jgi:hypothetical protein
MHVVRNRPEVVEELAEEIPAVLSLHDVGANQQIASFLDGFLQQEPFPVPEMDVTEALVGRRSRTVISIGRGREPSFVDTAAIAAKRVVIVWMQSETTSWKHERSGHPGRLETEQPSAGIYGILNLRSVGHIRIPELSSEKC